MNKIEYYLNLGKLTENFFAMNFQYDFDDLKIKKIYFEDSGKTEFQIFSRIYKYKYEWLPIPNLFLPLEKTEQFTNLIFRIPNEGTMFNTLENVFFENESDAREFIFILTKNKQKRIEEWVNI